MMSETADSRWENLQARAHLPEAQAVIRREIRRRTIRVVPAPGGGIRILSQRDTRPIDEPTHWAIMKIGLDENERRYPAQVSGGGPDESE